MPERGTADAEISRANILLYLRDLFFESDKKRSLFFVQMNSGSFHSFYYFPETRRRPAHELEKFPLEPFIRPAIHFHSFPHHVNVGFGVFYFFKKPVAGFIESGKLYGDSKSQKERSSTLPDRAPSGILGNATIFVLNDRHTTSFGQRGVPLQHYLYYNIINPMEETFISYAENELTEHLVYHKLALMEKKPDNRAALERLSAQEKAHYEFWKTLLPPAKAEKIHERAYTVWAIPLLRVVFGVTFITKLLETHETGAVQKYQDIAASIPTSHRERFAQIIEDEKSHERALIAQLKEKRLDYIGFIVLGLADAIVEITGVHAGFLGVTGSTLIAGVAGIIVGFSAAISMGSASYLQAKQDISKSAILSGFLTWASYFCSVVLLALPYFLIHVMFPAFIVSTSVGILLVAGFTFYGAVAFDRKFWREFAETVGLMLGTALATFLLGIVVGNIFHINPASF